MLTQYIISKPEILKGKPIIKGTRISVELILEKLATGESVEQILKTYPQLSLESIQAALSFAAQFLRQNFPTDDANPRPEVMKILEQSLIENAEVWAELSKH